MLKSENQFNTKASIFPIEEWYTTESVNNPTFDASTGYTFDYPMRWLTDPSLNKAIGIRRLQLTPTSHSFNLRLTATTSVGERSITKRFDITTANNMLEIINNIVEQLQLTTIVVSGGKPDVQLHYDYNSTSGDLILCCVEKETKTIPFKLELIDNDRKVIPNPKSLLKFFNQPLDNGEILTNFSEFKNLYSVWDREKLYFHASFSSSKKQLIGINGDFYKQPSLLYPSPTNTSEFYIYFTTNHTNRIIPLYCSFDIQLCFILNYNKTVIEL